MSIDAAIAERPTVTPRPVPDRIINMMTVDVEDYFQVSAFERHVARDRWATFESRVSRNTERLLELFDDAQVTATFFVLGWVAERYPRLVGQIAAKGHEVASHSHEHRLVYDMTPASFAEDLRRAKGAIESASGTPVLGYRAPSFSITRRSTWALDVLIAEGYRYDASIYPIHHDRYGISDAPRFANVIVRQGGSLWEFPGSTVKVGGQNLPIGGGGYFRLFPYRLTRRAITRVNTIEKQPVMFYLHPWEIDPAQPRIQGTVLNRFRHYQNLDKTEGRLNRLLSDFAFDSIATCLSGLPS